MLWEASPESGADVCLAFGSIRGRFYVTCAPSESRWYELFARGVCARMGGVVRQDRAFTIEVLHRLLSMFEAEWQGQGLRMPAKDISACMFLLVC